MFGCVFGLPQQNEERAHESPVLDPHTLPALFYRHLENRHETRDYSPVALEIVYQFPEGLLSQLTLKVDDGARSGCEESMMLMVHIEQSGDVF